MNSEYITYKTIEASGISIQGEYINFNTKHPMNGGCAYRIQYTLFGRTHMTKIKVIYQMHYFTRNKIHRYTGIIR